MVEDFKAVRAKELKQGSKTQFRMTYSNLDFFNRTILIVRGKTKNAKRTLSISPEVFELLKKRRQSHPDDYWVFPSPRKPGTHLGSVRKAHDNVCEKMGLRGAIDLYNLRHTFATRSILSGTDVTILQKILGHSEIGMTMRYVKIAEHYKVEAVVKLEKYRAVKMQEAVVKMQQEEEKLGMLQ
jgi:integrase